MTVQDTLNQRDSIYGDFIDVSETAQKLKNIMKNSKNWEKLCHAQKEALDLIATKISRILNGNPDYKDNWHDGSGYFQLIEKILK